jgi:ribosomal protein S18 acetylase RimI-like enzyme
LAAWLAVLLAKYNYFMSASLSSFRATIREATRVDAAEVVRLIQTSVDKGSPLTEDYVHEYLDSPKSKILLAEKGGKAVGLLSYSIRPDLWHATICCFIEEITVEESERGQGIGTRLINSVMEKMRNSNCAEVVLTVDKENIAAQRLYKRLGIDEELMCLEKHL